MAKGSIAKQEVAEGILAAFPGSFLYNDGKEIRINTTENGEQVQIKCVLTAAKVAVSPDGDVAIPGAAAPVQRGAWDDTETPSTPAEPTPPPAPTQNDRETVATLLASLGF